MLLTHSSKVCQAPDSARRHAKCWESKGEKGSHAIGLLTGMKLETGRLGAGLMRYCREVDTYRELGCHGVECCVQNQTQGNSNPALLAAGQAEPSQDH